MHFNRRAESAHSKLKKHLDSSLCNFEQAWFKMHSLLELSFTELKASFEQSLTKVKHVFHIKEFKNLRGVVSTKALDLIHSEIVRIQAVRDDEALCGCVIRKTHGLPCAHELACLGSNLPIPLAMVDVHWTRLHLIERKDEKKNEPGVLEKMELLLNDVRKMDTPYQLQIYKKMLEVVQPQTSNLASPKCKTKTRGRESKRSAQSSTKRMLSSFELVPSLASQSPSMEESVNGKKRRIDKLPIRKPIKVRVVEFVFQ